MHRCDRGTNQANQHVGPTSFPQWKGYGGSGRPPLPWWPPPGGAAATAPLLRPRLRSGRGRAHNAAHGKSTASSPAGRYYGSASSTPALVFPRLCKLANIHLEKIGGGLAYKLQHGVPKERAETLLEQDFEGLAGLIARFSADAKWPRTLSLEDQGRFAIGYYYEKCRHWPRYRKGTNPKGDEQTTEDNQPSVDSHQS